MKKISLVLAVMAAVLSAGTTAFAGSLEDRAAQLFRDGTISYREDRTMAFQNSMNHIGLTRTQFVIRIAKGVVKDDFQPSTDEIIIRDGIIVAADQVVRHGTEVELTLVLHDVDQDTWARPVRVAPHRDMVLVYPTGVIHFEYRHAFQIPAEVTILGWKGRESGRLPLVPTILNPGATVHMSDYSHITYYLWTAHTEQTWPNPNSIEELVAQLKAERRSELKEIKDVIGDGYEITGVSNNHNLTASPVLSIVRDGVALKDGDKVGSNPATFRWYYASNSTDKPIVSDDVTPTTPVIPTIPTTPTTGDSEGGGCNTGFGLFALAIPLFLRRK